MPNEAFDRKKLTRKILMQTHVSPGGSVAGRSIQTCERALLQGARMRRPVVLSAAALFINCCSLTAPLCVSRMSMQRTPVLVAGDMRPAVSITLERRGMDRA